MPAEQDIFLVAIVLLIGLVIWMTWLRFTDKWKEADREDKYGIPPKGPYEVASDKTEMQRCGNCNVQYPTFFNHCPNCGKK